MQRYAVAHAVKGVTFVAKPGNGAGLPEILRLKDDPAAPSGKGQKVNFLGQLQPGDELFLELGGAADRLALAAIAHGATVHRMPSFLLGPDRTREIVAQAGWELTEERALGEETSDLLTARKARALALLTLSTSDPGQFLTAKEEDVLLLKLRVAYRAFWRSKLAIMRAYQGLLSSYRDQAFLELAFARQEKARVSDEDMHSYVLERLIEDMLGGEISETARADFFAAIGRQFEGGRLPARATEETVGTIVEAMLESDAFHATVLERLKSQQKMIERMLKGGRQPRQTGQEKARVLPGNVIWEQVFEPIPGCGPLIAARFIAAIGDIRRFEDLAALKAYAGYHHFADGSRARRVAGKVSNWHQELKQAVYLLCQQTLKLPSSPWRARLDQRKAYELYNILKERQRQADEQGLNYEILPLEFRRPKITSANDMQPADYSVYRPTGRFNKKGKEIMKLVAGLAFHVHHLRELAGITSDSEEMGEDAETSGKETEIKDPVLAKLVRGVLQQAQDKALRWLGQQFLKHIFKEWRKAVGLPELPVRPAKSAAEA